MVHLDTRIDPCMVDISIALLGKISPSDDFETKLVKIPQSTTLGKYMVHWHIKPYHVVFLEASSQLRDFLLIQLLYMARRKFHPLIKPETSCQYEWNIGRPQYFGQCNYTLGLIEYFFHNIGNNFALLYKILPSDDFETKLGKFLYSNNKMHKITINYSNDIIDLYLRYAM